MQKIEFLGATKVGATQVGATRADRPSTPLMELLWSALPSLCYCVRYGNCCDCGCWGQAHGHCGQTLALRPVAARQLRDSCAASAVHEG